MNSTHRIRRSLLAASLVPAALALAVIPSAIAAKVPAPRFSTGGVSHVSGTTGQLEGSVNGEGFATSYYFQYGPTIAYGAKTLPVALPPPNPPKVVAVGQSVTGLLPGYHYRIVGIYTATNGKTMEPAGHDKTFSGGNALKLRFVVGKGHEEQISTVYGGTAELSASLTGLNNAGQALTLQATPFPFKSPFANLGGAVLTSPTGSFVFKIATLLQNTELRVQTLGSRPTFSPVIVAHVTPRITLRVRSAGHTGLYRVYGRVFPARAGASIQLEQLLPQKAGSHRSGPLPHVVGSSVLKRATSQMSRFSIVVRLTGTFHYRVYVRLPKGAIDSGHSGNVLIRAPRPTSKAKRK